MKIKGAKIVVECLINEGVEKIFGYPGGYAIDMFDELYQAQDRIQQVLTCHEQGACHAADGYARASGKVGVVIATSGPGATNLVTGIANAYMDSVPLVAITGNVTLSNLGRDSFQEVDIAGVTMPVTKHNYIVKNITELAEIFQEAFFLARSGRPGPVLIDIPKNVQQDLCEYTPLPPRPVVHKTPSPESLKAAAEIIAESKKPLIYYGGGVISSNASKELIAFAEHIDAPVTSSMMGLGAFPASHPLYTSLIGMHGHAGVTRLTRECDCLITIGARFSDRVAGDRGKFASQAKIVHIDIDNAEINKNVNTAAHVVSDAKIALSALTKMLKKSEHKDWLKTVKEHMTALKVKESLQKLNPRDILRSICRQTPDNQIIATDVGQHQMWTIQSYRFEHPRTLISSGGLGTMGFGVGAAIGASMAANRRAALITGDGSFHMNFNEVVTATKYNVPLTVFVFNNNTLGMVRQWQKLFYGKRFSSTTLDRPTNYEYLAKAMGAEYFEINENSQIDETVKKAMNAKGAVIVNCTIFIDENVLPMIPAGKSAEDVILEVPD